MLFVSTGQFTGPLAGGLGINMTKVHHRFYCVTAISQFVVCSQERRSKFRDAIGWVESGNGLCKFHITADAMTNKVRY